MMHKTALSSFLTKSVTNQKFDKKSYNLWGFLALIAVNWLLKFRNSTFVWNLHFDSRTVLKQNNFFWMITKTMLYTHEEWKMIITTQSYFTPVTILALCCKTNTSITWIYLSLASSIVLRVIELLILQMYRLNLWTACGHW